MKPTIGRIVHYVSYGTPGGEFLPEHRAAIVTAVDPGTEGLVPESVSLFVMNPTGVFLNSGVLHDEEAKKGGTWHWPERADG